MRDPAQPSIGPSPSSLWLYAAQGNKQEHQLHYHLSGKRFIICSLYPCASSNRSRKTAQLAYWQKTRPTIS